MRKPFELFLLFLCALLFASPCLAQDVPAWEVSGAYSFHRADVRQYFRSTPIIYSIRGRYVNLPGWSLSVTENRGRWFGGTLDARFQYNDPLVPGATPQLAPAPNRQRIYSLMYGPRLSYRIWRLTPYGNVLFGAAHARVSVTPVGPNVNDTSFAIAAGGGVDLKIGGKFGVRVLQADYLRTNLLGTRPHGFRASSGVVFYLGQR
jgi:hypothetical protein